MKRELLIGVEPSRTPLTDDYVDDDQGLKARTEGLYDGIAKKARESGQCVFCNLKEEFVIAHYHGWTAFTNFHPRSRANLLFAPDRHLTSMTKFTNKDAIARQRLEQLMYSLLGECFGLTAVHFLLREGSEDKTVDHTHSHAMHYYHGIMKWYNEAEMKDRVFRTPEQVGQPLLPRVIVARTMQQALAKAMEINQ